MPWSLIMNRWVIGGLAAAILLGVTHYRAYTAGKTNVEAKWSVYRAEQAEKLAAAEARARHAEQAAQAAANQHQQEKRDAVNRLNREHAALVDSLRERAQRPAGDGVPGATGTAQGQLGCTGAELHREDAEFLAREAARADELRAELEACYAQYDSIRKLTR